MAKTKTIYQCTNCGATQTKWAGKCPDCGTWNSLEETESYAPKNKIISNSNIDVKSLDEIEIDYTERIDLNIGELNRVLGGGLMKGSIVFLGGDPGIGKSTLLLQICNNIDKKILYISGEESLAQIKSRANRLNIKNNKLFLVNEGDINEIAITISKTSPDILIIDSLQTMYSPEIPGAVGSISQIREVTSFFTAICKKNKISSFLIGHVTKDGSIAGPKTLEHLVDTVLFFEGEKCEQYRMLRCFKNRFGATDEIGIFEMTENGFDEVPNASNIFINSEIEEPGCSISYISEGTRNFLIEVQSLVSKSNFGNPRRVASGIDYNRFNLLIAVLEKKCNLDFYSYDCYLNIVGGFKTDDRSSDLSIACSLISSILNKRVQEKTVFMGELSLTGEIRHISKLNKKIEEAEKMGFYQIVIPYKNYEKIKDKQKYKIKIIPIKKIKDIFNLFEK